MKYKQLAFVLTNIFIVRYNITNGSQIVCGAVIYLQCVL